MSGRRPEGPASFQAPSHVITVTWGGTALRLTPCLLGLYTAIVLLYLQLPKTSRTLGAVFWKGKSTVTFSDMITCVRRALWRQWCFHTQDDPQEFSKLSRALQETLLYALAPAA